MGQFNQPIDPLLVQRAREADAAAIAALFERFSGAVFNLGYRLLGRREAAEEVVQDSFVLVLRRIGSFRGEAPFGAWLRQIAVRLCLAQMRSPWRRRRMTLDTEAPGAADIPDDLLALQQALTRLPPLGRTVVWLHDVEGMTHAEIAATLGKSPSFSKSQLARAYGRLRQELDDAEEAACMPATHNS